MWAWEALRSAVTRETDQVAGLLHRMYDIAPRQVFYAWLPEKYKHITPLSPPDDLFAEVEYLTKWYWCKQCGAVFVNTTQWHEAIRAIFSRSPPASCSLWYTLRQEYRWPPSTKFINVNFNTKNHSPCLLGNPPGKCTKLSFHSKINLKLSGQLSMRT